MIEVETHDAYVPGPAAGIDPTLLDGLNRLGSVKVPVRVYRPIGQGRQGAYTPWATMVWAHGGSFMRGNLDWPEADWVARSFAETGILVYSVDYALASETIKAPAPSNDVAAVLKYALAAHDGPVLIAGASAGGHLAATAALTVIERLDTPVSPRPAALLMVYPTLHREQRRVRRIAKATAKLPAQRQFGAQRINEMYDFYLGGGDACCVGPIPEFSGTPKVMGELAPERLGQLPPTVIVNADADDLRASAEQFAEQLRDAGVPVTQTVQKGTVHGYLNRPEESKAARRNARATIDYLSAAAAGIVAGSRGSARPYPFAAHDSRATPVRGKRRAGAELLLALVALGVVLGAGYVLFARE